MTIKKLAKELKISHWFYDRPIRQKQLIGLFTSEVISVLGLVSVGALLIIQGGRSQLLQQAESELKVTEINYNIKVDQTLSSLDSISETEAIIRAASENVSEAAIRNIKVALINESWKLNLDFVALVNLQRQLVTATGIKTLNTIIDPNALASQAFSTGQSVSSTEWISYDTLAAISPRAAQLRAIELGAEPKTKPNFLVRYTITPVRKPNNEIVGALIAGDVVKAPIVTDTVEAFDGGYSAVYLTFRDEFHLAASQLRSSKEQIKNVQLSNNRLLQKAIAAQGRVVTGSAKIQDQSYMVAAKALFDHQQSPVAILVRGTPKHALNQLLKNNLITQIGVAILALAADIILAVMLTRAIANPIKKLQQITQQFAAGHLTTRAEGFANDEVGQLADDFNQMADSIVDTLGSKSRVEDMLRHTSLHDSLTDLPNRAFFMERLEHTVQWSAQVKSQFAILFCDLNRFKIINDSLGHLIGDQLLIATAQRLKSVLRANDMLARLGGDEFTILVDNIHALPEAIGVAERINLALSKPFNLKGHEVSVGTSIGIALSTENNLSAEVLLRNADIAMYQAKREKQSYAIFNVNMHEQVVARLKLETDLQQALSRRELSLNYQPIVSLSTSQLIGFEALLRWHHPVYGTVAPDQFISIAEDNGLIVEIEQWVLSQACQQLKDWQLRFPSFADLTMSVNLSIQHLQESALPLQLDRILEQANLASHFLRLEITESTLMANAQVAEAVLNELSIRHIQLSVDDFGTGYSSLSYLHRFPLQTLKIDRSFVERLVTKDDSKAIVQSIVTLSHSLNMNVIAEGIETHAQLQQLIALGCELGQGYLFSKPLTASAAEAFITQQSAVTSLSSL